MRRGGAIFVSAVLVVACSDLKSAPPSSDSADGGEDNPGETPSGSGKDGGVDTAAPDGGETKTEKNGDPRWPQWEVPPDAPPAANFDLTQHAKDPIAVDKTTGLVWHRRLPDKGMSWKDASNYCDDLFYADKADWRLPTRIEAISIASFPPDQMNFEPATLQAFYPQSGCYWTASTFPKSEDHWQVWNDRVGQYMSSAQCFPRCVRGGPALGPAVEPAYVSKGSSLVFDPGTNLYWEHLSPTDKTSWDSADARCKKLVLDGHQMRLPTVKELASIVDETRAGPALHPALAPTSDRMHTSNENFAVDFFYGYVTTNDVQAGSRCVASK